MGFNPSMLTPTGQRWLMSPEEIGMREDTYQDIPAGQRPYKAAYMTPDGKTMIGYTDPRSGRTSYETERIGQNSIMFVQGDNGQWEPQERKAGDGGYFKAIGKQVVDTFKDNPEFVAFLAAAAGGAIASAYVGGGAMASGAVAEGTVAAQTAGAGTAGGVAGAGSGVTASQISGAVGSPELGMVATPGTANTAIAGGIPASSLSGGSGALTLGNIANGTNTVSSSDPSKAGLIRRLLGDNASPSTVNAISGLLNSGVNSYLSNQNQQQMNEATQRAADSVLSAGREAADLAKFTPYNVSGGLAGVNFDGNNITQTLDPRLQRVQDASLRSSEGFLGGINAGTPQEQANQAYANYLAWAKPQQNQQFSGLQDRLNKQGLLGLNVNTTALPGSGSTGTIGVNPYYKDFAQGVTLADLKNYENSIKFGQEVTGNQINLGKSMLGIGTGIDQLGLDRAKLGAEVGNYRANAGYRAGGFLNDSARTAADLVLDRNKSEAAGDAERNRQIWETIYRNIL